MRETSKWILFVLGTIGLYAFLFNEDLRKEAAELAGSIEEWRAAAHVKPQDEHGTVA